MIKFDRKKNPSPTSHIQHAEAMQEFYSPNNKAKHPPMEKDELGRKEAWTTKRKVGKGTSTTTDWPQQSVSKRPESYLQTISDEYTVQRM